MNKRVKCDACGGRGVIIPKRHGGMVMPRECEYCNGTGTVDAPMTNADLIRAMNDRQLAEFLAAKFTDNTQVQEAMKGNHMTATQLSETSHAWFVGWMTWLQQPAEEKEYV